VPQVALFLLLLEIFREESLVLGAFDRWNPNLRHVSVQFLADRLADKVVRLEEPLLKAFALLFSL